MPTIKHPIFLVERSYGIFGYITRLLISIRYGLNFARTYSHVAMVLPDKGIVSAESKGVVLAPITYDEGKSSYIEYYSIEMTDDQAQKITDCALSQVGKGYNYYRYLYNSFNIFAFVFILFSFLLILPLGFKNSLFIFILGNLFRLAAVILRTKDKLALDCSGSVSQALIAGNCYSPIGLYINSFPEQLRSVYQTLGLFGKAKLIKIKNRKDPVPTIFEY